MHMFCKFYPEGLNGIGTVEKQGDMLGGRCSQMGEVG